MNNPDTFNPSEGGARQEMADRGADTQRLAHAIGRGRVGIRGVLAIMAVLGGAAALEARAEEPSAAASLCQIDQGPEGNFGWVLLKGKCDKDGLAEGYGEARSAIGSTYKGHYHKGKRHGKGVYMLADGAVFTGQWQEDNPVDEESVWSFKHPKYKTPNAMYVYAGQLEAKRTVFEAKMVYNHIIRTFPDSDVAVKATDRLAQLRQPEEKPAHKEAPPESGSDFPADIIATFDQLRPLLPKDDANPILPGNRQQAIAIVRRLVERYPNEADAHVLMSGVALRALQGDLAVQHYNRACELVAEECQKRDDLLQQVEAALNTCLTEKGEETEAICALAETSSATLNQRVVGKYLTNNGMLQEWIGRIVSVRGRVFSITMTYARDPSFYLKGKTYDIFFDKAKPLEGTSVDATIQGWK